MGKFLIWLMCLVGYWHVLGRLELSTPCNIFFMLIAVAAFILWCGEE